MFLLFQQTFHNVFYVKYLRYFEMFNARAPTSDCYYDYYENYIQYNVRRLIFLYYFVRQAFVTIRYCECIIIFRHIFIFMLEILILCDCKRHDRTYVYTGYTQICVYIYIYS